MVWLALTFGGWVWNWFFAKAVVVGPGGSWSWLTSMGTFFILRVKTSFAR